MFQNNGTLEAIAKKEGHRNALDMLQTCMSEGVAPGYCNACGATMGPVETDARAYACDICGEGNSVDSVMVIAGII